MNVIACLIVAAAVTADPNSHSVTLSASATGITKPSPLEFLIVGPGSDHDYESMFVADADIGEIAKAFKDAGISNGRAVDPTKARFWPVGDFLKIKPEFDSLVRECHELPLRPISFTGGSRTDDGAPVAATNMPLALFAFYNLPQSLIQFDEALDQSVAYGRFKPAKQFKTGEKVTFKFTLAKKNANIAVSPEFKSNNAAEILSQLREKANNAELDVIPHFSGDMTLEEARKIAELLSMLDSPQIKINGYAPGQFFYQSFLPKEAWRDRKERLCQPPELHYTDDGKFIVIDIKESWSKDDNVLDPILTPTSFTFDNIEEAAKLCDKLGDYTSTILVYAPESIKLSELYKMRSYIKGGILNYYFLQK